MADFAKSIFGFGGFKNRDPSPQPGHSRPQGLQAPPSSHHHHQSHPQAPPSASSLSASSPDYPLVPASSHDQYSQQYPLADDIDNQNKFFPKGLGHVTPTTAVSDHSMAYGTTSTANTSTNLEAFLNQTFKTNEFAHKQHQQFDKFYPPQNQPQPPAQFLGAAHPVQAYASDGQLPLIITTDETGQNINTQSRNSQPKGKLKLTILETRDVDAAQPYIVCTFESSEFVTNAPSSYGKSPSNSPFNGHKQQPPLNGNLNAHLHNSNHPASRALPMKNSNRPAMYQRQSSTQHLQLYSEPSNPVINHEAFFDVVGSKSELDISVYDAARDDSFLGHARIFPSTIANKKSQGEWLPLKARVVGERVSSGAVKISWEYTSLDNKKSYGPDDFEVLRLLGKGTFGQVFQVKKNDTDRIYAMKVLSKKVIVKKKEIAHTIGERNILVRTSAAASPFIVGLKFSFQTPTDLYLVTDYMSGGELFWHLQKEGRFAEDRAKFYIAELVLALEHLHDNDIVYRDLKPENILLDANGHIALCDFGLSKANLNNDGTTNTFCGTTEYLAPEVLLDESGYTKMVDFWSLGVLIFEMCCGWSPFYADNTQQMYKNIAFGKVRFPKEVLSPEGRSFVKGLLNRNPKHRLGATNDARELRAHPFFSDIDWNLLKAKSIPPPFKPHLTSETDTSNFDPEFTSESTSVLKKQMEMASTPLSPGIQANFKGFTYVDDSAMEDHFGKSHRMNTFKNPGSFIPGNPNLPPDEDVIDDDQIDEEDEMETDEDHHMDDEEFVNGRFDL
ncbi:Pkinase-domain-containing protein [Suhomyces tanzawaensis NRRL Y-17324]|uniref:Serine/threonine-protein kinase SCH9 n=1 Tax=Suhomyces tanzawaensis NRRL Y-17324 TaxID=984487 RepID=A0A1E4SJV0_9ASCO|nr:Pkinase-domain-containing protein [Suhomyces tanzawaensis NRRL Y-17324]ODV79786.1 Pkinase-domain-containing protein [Suhomyces tanzawaensis NRRL Y-17324]